MDGKLTFSDVYKDFKNRHPRLKKQVVDWKPHNAYQIKIWLNDGKTLIYDYYYHEAKFVVS